MIHSSPVGGRSPRRTRRSIAAVIALGAAASLVLAACSSGDTAAEAPATTAAAEAPATTAAAEAPASEAPASEAPASEAPAEAASGDVQAVVNQVLRTDAIDAASLDPTIQSALARVATPLPEDKLQLALECWKSMDCEVPGGGDVTVGYISPEVNTWRKVSRMEAILQALTYPEVGRIISVTPEFDLAQMQAGVRSLAADGANVIVGYNDFGSALAPAFKQAVDGGALTSIFVGPAPDAPPGSFTTQVTGDVCAIGKEMAQKAAELVNNKGDIVFFNGTPGNPQGATWNKCAEEELAANFPDVKVVGKYDTGWTLQGAFEAATALLASGEEPKVVLYDYADPMPQIVKAYEQAGKGAPDMVTWTSNNDLYRVWEENVGKDTEFALADTNSINWPARVSVTALMDQLTQGKQAPELVIYPMPFINATEGLYDPNYGADYPGSTLVPDSVMSGMLSGG